jgi:hypothetical protein
MLLSFVDGIVLDPKEYKNTLAIEDFIPSELEIKENKHLSNAGLILTSIDFYTKNVKIKPFVDDETDIATYILDCSTIEKPQKNRLYGWDYIFNSFCFINNTTIPYEINVRFNKSWSFSYRPLAILNGMTVNLPWYKPSSKDEYSSSKNEY